MSHPTPDPDQSDPGQSDPGQSGNDRETRMERLDRTARGLSLGLLEVPILIGSVAAAITAASRLGAQFTRTGGMVPSDLTDHAQAQALAALTGLPSGTSLQFASQSFPVELHVEALSLPTRLLTQAGPSLLLACLAVAGFLLQRTLRTIRTGAPFAPGNPLRLRVIGLLIVVGGMGSAVLDMFARMAVFDAVGLTDGPVRFSAVLQLSWALGGLAALALAEAFDRGRILTDDVAGLI